MEDIVILLLLAVIIGLAVAYIVKQKKKGNKCIGCPHCNACGRDVKCEKFD